MNLIRRRWLLVLELATLVLLLLVYFFWAPCTHCPPITPGGRCARNLSQMYKFMLMPTMKHGERGSLPPQTGSAFWLGLSRTSPPLIDDQEPESWKLFSCPVMNRVLPPGETDYRGPKVDVNTLQEDDPIGADKEGNHGPGKGGCVLLKSGEVKVVEADDPLWLRAAETTCP